SAERKRRVYDQYGKEGLQMPGGKRRHEEDFDFNFNPFVFRDPEDVFREFFGGNSPFDLFADLHGHSRGHRNRNAGNSISTSFFSPFGHFDSAFGDIFGGGFGMNNCTTFSTCASFGGPSNNGPREMKRTSTSTRFINGKKITTKKVYENGKETIMSYENDVLKSKTENGVPIAYTPTDDEGVGNHAKQGSPSPKLQTTGSQSSKSEQAVRSPSSKTEQTGSSPSSKAQQTKSSASSNLHQPSNPSTKSYQASSPSSKIHQTTTSPSTKSYQTSSPSTGLPSSKTTYNPSSKLYPTSSPSSRLYSSTNPNSRLFSSSSPSSKLNLTGTPSSRLYSATSPSSRLHTANSPSSRLYSSANPSSKLYSGSGPIPKSSYLTKRKK
ncbi:putative protein TPRXL, partial [Copidosoma floridanum]|uniref:putative protein TPRXL n=1 Tax=Copidosoma floridanum TaxID=29053 RepID=UPI000C6F72E8